jgi:hypothetical protein
MERRSGSADGWAVVSRGLIGRGGGTWGVIGDDAGARPCSASVRVAHGSTTRWLGAASLTVGASSAWVGAGAAATASGVEASTECELGEASTKTAGTVTATNRGNTVGDGVGLDHDAAAAANPTCTAIAGTRPDHGSRGGLRMADRRPGGSYGIAAVRLRGLAALLLTDLSS